MGVAYFILLDNPDPGFDTFVNGKGFARALIDIHPITEQLGLPGIDDFTGFTDLGDEFEVPEAEREKDDPWFEPQEGLRWLAGVRRHIETHPDAVNEPDEVLADLAEYEQVLRKADAIGAKWRFEMDL